MHYKQNNKETRYYVQGLRSFGNTLPNGVKKILKKNGYNYTEIISKWSSFAGKEVSGCSYPKSIKMSRGDSNGTLILAVSRGDEITVEYAKREIINKINSYFGYQLISFVKIQSFNKENKKIKNKNIIGNFSKNFGDKINKIKNENIKNSLSKLLDAIKKND